MISLRSEIAQKVLAYFLLNPEEQLYINEIANKFKVDAGNLFRKLSEWEKEGLLIKNKKGNLSLYKINKDYYLLPEIQRIVQKSFGIEKRLKDIFIGEKGIKQAVIFGSYAKNKMEPESDIDVLLIGSHDSLDIQKKLHELEKDVGREVNVIDMTEGEFEKKKKENEFIKNIFNEKYIQII